MEADEYFVKEVELFDRTVQELSHLLDRAEPSKTRDEPVDSYLEALERATDRYLSEADVVEKDIAIRASWPRQDGDALTRLAALAAVDFTLATRLSTLASAHLECEDVDSGLGGEQPSVQEDQEPFSDQLGQLIEQMKHGDVTDSGTDAHLQRVPEVVGHHHVSLIARPVNLIVDGTSDSIIRIIQAVKWPRLSIMLELARHSLSSDGRGIVLNLMRTLNSLGKRLASVVVKVISAGWNRLRGVLAGTSVEELVEKGSMWVQQRWDEIRVPELRVTPLRSFLDADDLIQRADQYVLMSYPHQAPAIREACARIADEHAKRLSPVKKAAWALAAVSLLPVVEGIRSLLLVVAAGLLIYVLWLAHDHLDTEFGVPDRVWGIGHIVYDGFQ